MTFPQIKPSPVHESSLRQALQRVEDRIRQQERERQKDDRHERTRKIARELAVEGVRQRQKAWERQHQKIESADPVPHHEETEDPAVQGAAAAALPYPKPSKGSLPAWHATPLRRGIRRFMPAVAWLILVIGIVGAILSWTTITNVQANTLPLSGSKMNGWPLGLLLGFAYLATGVLGFAFFWVASLIANQLRDIRRLLFLQPVLSGKPDDDLP